MDQQINQFSTLAPGLNGFLAVSDDFSCYFAFIRTIADIFGLKTEIVSLQVNNCALCLRRELVQELRKLAVKARGFFVGCLCVSLEGLLECFVRFHVT